MARNCIELLKAAMDTNHTLVCCGLDPDVTKMPLELIDQGGSLETRVLKFLQIVIDHTAGYVCAYKIQKAFFDLLPDGHQLLESIIDYAQSNYADIPVILDCKIGDIDNTMSAYMRNVFENLKADAVVVNPYMGDEVMQPFESLPNKAAIVLVKTSNAGGSIVQDTILAETGEPLWMYILNQVVHRWNKAANLIPVLSSTSDADVSNVRKIIPDSMPVLFAGYGAQKGNLKQFHALLDSQKMGVFVNSSRGLLYPYESDDKNWRVAIENATLQMKDALNVARGNETI